MVGSESFQAAYLDVPRGVTIRTPVLDMTTSWTLSLPFHQFENHLRLGYNPISLPSPPRFPRVSTINNEIENQDPVEQITSFQEMIPTERQTYREANTLSRSENDVWTLDSSVSTALESVVPKAMDDESCYGFPVMQLDAQIFTSNLHRQALYSVANNFAGLDSSSVQDIFKLQRETTEKLYQMVRSARGYTSRAIIRNLFKAAIEAGDARAVDILIREHPTEVKINDQFCRIDGERYTPIERATILRHEALVETLLSHGARVNRTYRTTNSVGALEFAISRGHWQDRTPSHHGIFQKLFEAGGELSESFMRQAVEGDRELALLIISKHARTKATQWCQSGIFFEVLMCFNAQSCMKIIDIMLECGTNLNHPIDPVRFLDHNYPSIIIDIAAQRGMLSVVDRLLESGALITGDTMPCAAKSENQELILFLLERGANVNSIGPLEITTISEAIRLRNEQLLKFLEAQGATVINQTRAHYSAALLAASEVGNVQYIERLIELGGWARPKDLGYALIIAVREDRKETATALINAGADVNVDGSSYKSDSTSHQIIGPPLYEALERRAKSLVFSLLNADANPNYSFSSTSSALQLAVRWGDKSVVKALILVGADVNRYNAVGSYGKQSDSPLATAVDLRDFGMIDLLLASGADINCNEIGVHQNRTPLEAAAEIGDVDMARYLFSRGADPTSPGALHMAFLNSGILFDLLCEKCHARYLSAPGNFGVSVLVHAIKEGDQRVIKHLLQIGVNTEVMPMRNSSCRSNPLLTPFGHAITGQKEDVIECLLQHGCDPNGVAFEQFTWEPLDPYKPPQSRATAFLVVIETQNISLIKLLIKYNAKIDLPAWGPIKRTPLQRAAELGNLAIVTLLLDHRADVNEPPAFTGGGTSLQLAAIGGFITVVRKLFNHKADVNAPGSIVNGKTALEGAAEHGRLDMVKILLNAGAGSRRGDEGQIARAINLARENEFDPLCDLIEAHFNRPKDQGDESGMWLDDFDGELPEWDLDKDPYPF